MTIFPLVLISLVVVWVPVVPSLLTPSVTCLEGLLSLLSTMSKAHFGYLHWVECLPEMIHFFVEKLRIATHCFGPMDEGINYTNICLDVVCGCPTVDTGQCG